MKNKGFSLVELIIVIAIMAILAAAIAPALIRYIDKSRRADDVTAAGTVESSVSAALANEDAYDEAVKDSIKEEMESSLPKGADIKYKKKQASYYNVWTAGDGQIFVYLGKGTSSSEWMIRPSICKDYK